MMKDDVILKLRGNMEKGETALQELKEVDCDEEFLPALETLPSPGDFN